MNYYRILLFLERYKIRIPHDDVFNLQYGSHLIKSLTEKFVE